MAKAGAERSGVDEGLESQEAPPMRECTMFQDPPPLAASPAGKTTVTKTFKPISAVPESANLSLRLKSYMGSGLNSKEALHLARFDDIEGQAEVDVIEMSARGGPQLVKTTLADGSYFLTSEPPELEVDIDRLSVIAAMKHAHADTVHVLCQRLDRLEDLVLQLGERWSGASTACGNDDDSRSKGCSGAAAAVKAAFLRESSATSAMSSACLPTEDMECAALPPCKKDPQRCESPASSSSASKGSAEASTRCGSQQLRLHGDHKDPAKREAARAALTCSKAPSPTRSTSPKSMPVAEFESDVDFVESTFSRKLLKGVGTMLACSTFDVVMGLVVLANCALLGAELCALPSGDARLSEEEEAAALALLGGESAFLLVYAAELMLRFFAFGPRCLRNGWVLLDALLLVVGVFGSWVIPAASSWRMFTSLPFRIFRLLRSLRAVRLFGQIRQLGSLASELARCVPKIVNAMGIVMVVLFVFSCIGLEVMASNPLSSKGGRFQDIVEKHWSSWPLVLLTLVRFVTLDGMGDIYAPMISEDATLLLFFLPLLVVVCIVVVNLVTAVVTRSLLEQGRSKLEARSHGAERCACELYAKWKRALGSLGRGGSDSGSVSVDDLAGAPQDLRAELSSLVGADLLLELFDALDAGDCGQVSVEELCSGAAQIAALGGAAKSRSVVELLRLLRPATGLPSPGASN